MDSQFGLLLYRGFDKHTHTHTHTHTHEHDMFCGLKGGGAWLNLVEAMALEFAHFLAAFAFVV